MTPPRTRPVAIAAGGLALVTGYAAWAAIQILVLNPLAAAPGRTLDQIHADMDAAGQGTSIVPPLVILAIGPLLAAGILIGAAKGRLPARAAAAGILGLLTLGAFGYFAASFGWGMNLADTYGISGGDHSPWALPLCGVSLAAAAGLVILAALAVSGALASRRRRAAA